MTTVELRDLLDYIDAAEDTQAAVAHVATVWAMFVLAQEAVS